MAINKVIYGDETLIDLTEDTVNSDVLAKGVTAHRRDGVVIEGELDLEGMIADEYDSTATYSVGDYALYEGVLYQRISDISTPEEWNTEHWEAVTVTDELKKKAEIDGYYEDLTAGSAEQLISSVATSDNAPYNFRTSGGNVDIGNRETDKLVGGTVAWNQLVDKTAIDSTTTVNGITFTNNGDGSVTVSGTASDTARFTIRPAKTWGAHKYLLYGCPSGGASGTYSLRMRGQGGDSIDVGSGVIWNASGNSYKGIVIQVNSGVAISTAIIFKPQFIDITQLLGSTIADYIYSLEQANAGDGVAWFKKYFPKDFYSYNAGELMSVKTSGHKMTGFNQWDEEWEQGSISSTTGADTSPSSSNIRSKNYIPVIPNTSYYFKTSVNLGLRWYDADKNYIGNDAVNNSVKASPSNAYYLRFVAIGITTYNRDICINLHWDGERDGEYEAYEEHSYALDSDLELRGIPKLDAQNNLYYDGDTYESNGTVTRKYGTSSVNPNGLTNNGHNDDTSIYFAFYSVTGRAYTLNVMCDRFTRNSDSSVMRMVVRTNGNGIEFCLPYSLIGVTSADDDNTVKLPAAKTWFTNNVTNLVYELDTPTTETADPYQNPQIVNDWGTEEYIDNRDVPIPVGHETLYQANLKAKLEMAPNSPSDGDGLYGVRQTLGLNSYEKIVFPTELPSNPSSDGTYYLKSSVSEGTPVLTWSDDIPFEFANIYNLIGQLHNDNPTWNDVQALVRSGHAREAFPIGTVFEVTRTGQDTLYKVVADYDNPNYTLSASGHNMILIDVYAIYTKQFDARQALLYFPEAVEGNVTMNFLVKGAYYSDDNNKYIQFISPADGITAGSQLVLSNSYNATMIGTNAKLYTGFSDTTGVNVALSQGNSGTYIGQTDGTAAGTIELNHVHRAVLGSNNYGESAIDQWINSDAAANAWQTQRTHFQRPAAYANFAGYMNGMDPDFLNVLAETDVICRSNNVFELDGKLNKLYTITNRKFFLASRVELGYGAENNLYEGRVFELYATATDANKIKYDISNKTTARIWWLRSPYPSYASYARLVYASGSLGYSHASHGYGAVSACVIC